MANLQNIVKKGENRKARQTSVRAFIRLCNEGNLLKRFWEKIDWLISQSLILRLSNTKAHISVEDITRTPQLKPKQSS